VYVCVCVCAARGWGAGGGVPLQNAVVVFGRYGDKLVSLLVGT